MIGVGVADNPFTAARFAPGVLPWFADGDGELVRLLARARRDRARLQIVGPHGSGKTTLLVHLERAARASGVAVTRVRGSKGWWAACSTVPRGGLLLLDEAEELSAVSRAVLCALCSLLDARLVVTAHRDLGLGSLERRVVTPEVAQRIVARLLVDRAPAPDPHFVADALERHSGNLREVLFELYDRVEARKLGAQK